MPSILHPLRNAFTLDMCYTFDLNRTYGSLVVLFYYIQLRLLNFCKFDAGHCHFKLYWWFETEYSAWETAMSQERTGIFSYEYMGKFEKEVINYEAGKMRNRYKDFVENKHLLENVKYTEQ